MCRSSSHPRGYWPIVVVALLCGACAQHDVGICGNAGASVPVENRVAETRSIFGKVTRVSDGDTIWVTPNGGEKVKVRLDRIDAPEKDQPFGRESTEYLKKLVYGKDVEVTRASEGKIVYGLEAHQNVKR